MTNDIFKFTNHQTFLGTQLNSSRVYLRNREPYNTVNNHWITRGLVILCLMDIQETITYQLIENFRNRVENEKTDSI